MTDLLVLLAAAGAARRMRGPDKLTLPVGGVPLLRRQAQAALAAAAPVLVTLPPDDTGRRLALAGLPVRMETLPDAGEGLAASLRRGAGVGTAEGAAGLMVLLADMPDIGAADVAACAAAYRAAPDRVLRATAEDGTPGHPVILPARLFPVLAALSGDRGAREVVEAEAEVTLIPLPGRNALTNLDTPEDWAAWRAARGEPRHDEG